MIRITTDVFCDKCGDWEQGTTRFSSDSKAARKKAKARGWVYFLGNDYCPKCKKEIKGNETP